MTCVILKPKHRCCMCKKADDEPDVYLASINVSNPFSPTICLECAERSVKAIKATIKRKSA